MEERRRHLKGMDVFFNVILVHGNKGLLYKAI
jgi:hypothetical protein